MKNLTYIWMTLCLIAFYSCGTTDVWKEWESEGTPNPNRLKPSEIKDALCAADGWKLTYGGHDFYFQFFEDGTVIANSDTSIEEATTYTSYHFSVQNDQLVALTIDGGGHLSALTDGSAEDTYLISDIAGNKITSKGANNGTAMNLVAVTATEIDAQMEAKANLLMLLNMKKKGFMNGVVRNMDGTFVAHYAISASNNKIRFSTIENRVLTHQEAGVTIDGSMFKFSGITINGQEITKLTYSNAGEGSAKLEGAYGLKVTSNKDGASFYTGGSFKTYKISKNNNHGDAKEELWQEMGWRSVGDIEINDRATRPVIFCPGPENGVWYVAFNGNVSTKDELDRIYFANTGGYMLLGGDNRVADVEQNMVKFLTAWFHQDGFYLVQEVVDSKNYLYFLSPTTDNWFKAVK